MRYVSNTEYLAHGNNKGDTRGRSRDKNYNKKIVRNQENTNVGTIGRKVPSKRKDLNMILLEGHDSLYHSSD